MKRKGSYRKLSQPKTKAEWLQHRRILLRRSTLAASTIRFARIEADITQKELARELRICSGTMFMREAGIKVKIDATIIAQHMNAILRITERRERRAS